MHSRHLVAVDDLSPAGFGQLGVDYPLTDFGNAEAFRDLHQNAVRYVVPRKQWLIYSAGRWRPDPNDEVGRRAKETIRLLAHQAAELQGTERQEAMRHIATSESEPRLRAMRTLAQSELPIALGHDETDRDPWLLACANGTLDLRTGKLRAHDPADLISLGTDVPFESDATCPRWIQFLQEVFAADPDLIGFVRRAVGYALSGVVQEHVLFVLHGAGCNGKTTFVEVLQRIVGDFARTSPFESFMRSRNDKSIRNDVARLHRARFVVASESGEGRRLDEATIKQVTGGDTIAARFLYDEFFEFVPQFKLWLVTNHRPRVDANDDAIWRRLRLIPFNISFEGREDQKLRGTLEKELPGILNWAVQGCLEWQRDGLGRAQP